MRKRMMSGNDIVLGKDGSGIGEDGSGIGKDGDGVAKNGFEGRWFVNNMDVEDVYISEKHW